MASSRGRVHPSFTTGRGETSPAVGTVTAVSATELDRLIPLRAVHNFRDLGGYPAADGRTTAWRTLYRADGLHRLDGEDLDAVRALGIRTVIDLRTVAELEERGRFPVHAHPVDFHHLPIIDVVWGPDEAPGTDHEHEIVEFMAGKYLEMFAMGEAHLATALRVLTRPDALPAVFHCAAGKDRTGILAAVILALLGVPDEVIAHDYALSRGAMERMVAWFRVQYPDMAAQMADTPAAFLAAHPATMLGVLGLVRWEHGSMEEYVRSIGVDDGVIGALRERLLT